ncbi:MAG: glycosyltransferase [Deltaproteobacteria bacterium]|nr:glycosyltransferase [Deltaproteobacteria bacterium]
MGIAGKKVLLTTSHRRIGSGGSFQLLLLARSLTRAGADVHAVFAKPDAVTGDTGFERLTECGVRVHTMHPGRWYSPIQIGRMRRLLSRERFDIVHTHKGGDLSLVLAASTGLAIPALVTTRGVNFPLGANRYKYNARKLDRIITVSEDIKRVMVRSGVREEKIRVIYGGVDTDRFRPIPERREAVRRALGVSENATVALVVANLVRQKGHVDYLHAAAQLKTHLPGVVHLFAGKGDQSVLRENVAELGLEGRVHFLGFRDDVEDLYAASDFSVVASVAGEGVSGVLRESMACGVPVITTDVGGNAELVTHGQTGARRPARERGTADGGHGAFGGGCEAAAIAVGERPRFDSRKAQRASPRAAHLQSL